MTIPSPVALGFRVGNPEWNSELRFNFVSVMVTCDTLFSHAPRRPLAGARRFPVTFCWIKLNSVLIFFWPSRANEPAQNRASTTCAKWNELS